MHVRSAGTTLSAASAASPLGSSTITAQRSRRRSSRDAGDQERGLALLDGARHRGVLPAQVGVDRHRPDARRAAARRRPAGARSPGRPARSRQRAAGERHVAEVDRRQLPQRRQLGRRVHARAARTAAGCPRRARPGGRRGRRSAWRNGRAALDEPVLGAAGRAPRRRSASQVRRSAADDAEVGEEQRPVLHVEAAAQLGHRELRAVALRTLLTPVAGVGERPLARAVQPAAVELEEPRHGRERDLQRARSAGRRHRADHAVARRAARASAGRRPWIGVTKSRRFFSRSTAGGGLTRAGKASKAVFG